jgi:hypothetical protein
VLESMKLQGVYKVKANVDVHIYHDQAIDTNLLLWYLYARGQMSDKFSTFDV